MIFSSWKGLVRSFLASNHLERLRMARLERGPLSSSRRKTMYLGKFLLGKVLVPGGNPRAEKSLAGCIALHLGRTA